MPFSSHPSPDPAPDDTRVALSVLATIDPVLRDRAVFGLVVGAPRVVRLERGAQALRLVAGRAGPGRVAGGGPAGRRRRPAGAPGAAPSRPRGAPSASRAA